MNLTKKNTPFNGEHVTTNTTGTQTTAASYSMLVIMGVIFLMIIVGNTFVLVCFAAQKSLRRSVYNVFIMNLSLSDFIVGWTMLFSILAFLFPEISLFKSYEMCSFSYTLSNIATVESSYQMIIISISCLFSIAKPFSYKLYFSPQKALVMIVLSWCVSVCHASLTPAIWADKHFYNNNTGCSTKHIYGVNYIKYQRGIFIPFSIFFPCLILVYCTLVYNLYKKIFSFPTAEVSKSTATSTSDFSANTSQVTDATQKSSPSYSPESSADSGKNGGKCYDKGLKSTRKAHNSQSQISGKTSRGRKEIRAVMNLTLLFLLYSVCFAPFCIYQGITAYAPAVVYDRTVQNYLVLIVFANSALNPIIYSLRMRNILAIVCCKNV